MTSTPTVDHPRGGAEGPGGHPLRRRLRRRHAADRRPLHLETAAFGNDLSTLPNFPAEIRAPAGTLPGVSSFQLHFANYDILTPGDRPDVLVAMNPAALKANIADLPRRRADLANTDEFTKRNLAKVGYAANPLRTARWSSTRVHPRRPDHADRRGALEDVRPVPQGRGAGEEHVRARPAVLDVPPAAPRAPSGFLREKFARRPDIADANILAFKTGLRLRRDHRGVRGHLRGRARAHARAGTYRQISGNLALAYGLVAAGQVRPAAVPRLVPDHPGVGHPARAVQAQARSTSPRSRPRTRSPASARRSARLRRRLGVTTTSGPGSRSSPRPSGWR